MDIRTREELGLIFDTLQMQLDYSKSDEQVFGNRKSVFLGKLDGFDTFLMEGVTCISHPELSIEDAVKLNGFLSANSLESATKRRYHHYPISRNRYIPCVTVNVVRRRPYLESEEYGPPVNITNLRKLHNLLASYHNLA